MFQGNVRLDANHPSMLVLWVAVLEWKLGNAENYLIQGADINHLFTSPRLEQVEAMYNEGAPDFFVDQGLYYLIITNYRYYYTEFESPGEWEDCHRIFGADGPEIHYAGAQTESSPHVNYALSYGHAQSFYNPYSPYISGAMIGIDGQYVGAQQYYAMPSYQDPESLPRYVPVVFQPDFVPNNLTDPMLVVAGGAFTTMPDGRSLKHGLASSSGAFLKYQTEPISNQTNSIMSKISET